MGIKTDKSIMIHANINSKLIEMTWMIIMPE